MPLSSIWPIFGSYSLPHATKYTNFPFELVKSLLPVVEPGGGTARTPPPHLPWYRRVRVGSPPPPNTHTHTHTHTSASQAPWFMVQMVPESSSREFPPPLPPPPLFSFSGSAGTMVYSGSWYHEVLIALPLKKYAYVHPRLQNPGSATGLKGHIYFAPLILEG